MENLDFIGGGQSQGDIAGLITQQGRLNVGQLRPFIGRDGQSYVSVYKGSGDPKLGENYSTFQMNTNAGTLQRDEWKQLDAAIQPIALNRLNGIQDLIDNGLTFNLGNAMGTTVLEYSDISDSMAAIMTMDGVTRSTGDRPVFGTNYLPIPIIHVDYEINARVLAASRSMNNPLDTVSAESATRKVAEKLEALLFTSTSYAFGGGTIYSYLNFPDRNQQTLATTWTDSGVDGANVITDILLMKQASMDALHYGPWMLYVPSAFETKLDEDYSTSKGSNTIRERILKIEGIKGIKVVDTLTAGNVLLVQMTSDTVRLVRGMGIENIQWKTEGMFVNKFKVLTIQVPQIRSDQAGNCGITHATFTA